MSDQSYGRTPEQKALGFRTKCDFDEISAALSKGKNLETITLFPHESWGRYPMPDNLGVNIIKSILKAFLNRSATYSNERFDWDRHCRLRSVSLGWIAWDIASEFEKKRGGKKVETIASPRIERGASTPHLLQG
ncbi:hypothetical protein M7I_6668 [Glarea lozoyensis 74030]|uniref:Uncharacterized protein n=1 Tax=Glarea lozoyensis (strain ATCC 74030 / MF5533) TaxID=1104152 RepID=H0EV74_GLAL7|nr:hypothetical protein M7I_6668 [Glarea lozoyensis 74030]